MTDFTRRGFIAALGAGAPIIGKLFDRSVTTRWYPGAVVQTWYDTPWHSPGGLFHTWIIRNCSEKHTVYLSSPDRVPDSSNGIALPPETTLTLEVDSRKPYPFLAASRAGVLTARNLTTGD